MADDRDDVEREHTTVVETGGGGGGGVLAVVLLIIVVLVLLYVFRGQLGFGTARASRPQHRQRERQPQLIERGRVASPRPPRGRGSQQGPRPFACAAMTL